MMPLHSKRSPSSVAAYIAAMTALAAVVGYLEQLIPVSFFGIPGVKLGLANIVSLIALYLFGKVHAFIIMTARVILVGLMFGNMYAIAFSLAGGVLSLIIMILLKKTGLFSITGVSAAGGAGHNAGQLITAILTLDSINLVYYIPVLMISGTVCGTVTGILAGVILNRTGMSLMKKERG